jgi:hypothetical protein
LSRQEEVLGRHLIHTLNDGRGIWALLKGEWRTKPLRVLRDPYLVTYVYFAKDMDREGFSEVSATEFHGEFYTCKSNQKGVWIHTINYLQGGKKRYLVKNEFTRLGSFIGNEKRLVEIWVKDFTTKGEVEGCEQLSLLA